MQYHIHQSNPPHFTEDVHQYRDYVGFVEANSVEEAFRLSQNGEKSWNATNPCRSTSVGDIIQAPDGFYMVKGIGFQKLS